MPAVTNAPGRERRRDVVRHGVQKVPKITLLFWVVKLLSTAMGESASDYLVFHIDPYVAVVAGSIGLVVALVIQLRADRYAAPVYWLAVVMVAVFGTMVADVAHVVLRVPYVLSAGSLAGLLLALFVVWHRVEGTLSIHSITTRRRELFYWATVIATFALGTALGDLTAATLGLGYPASALIFAVAFVLPAIAWRYFGANAVAAFWTSYVITRPLGASVADWLGKASLGGLGLGDGLIAVVLTVLIVVLVGYLTMTGEGSSGDASRALAAN